MREKPAGRRLASLAFDAKEALSITYFRFAPTRALDRGLPAMLTRKRVIHNFRAYGLWIAHAAGRATTDPVASDACAVCAIVPARAVANWRLIDLAYKL
jgi:hypothetical protein